MSYLSEDGGVATSKPVELYEFTNALGTVTRRTSYQRDFVFAANTYVATAALKRGQFAIIAGQDPPEMTVELPMSDALVSAYCGAGVPPQNLQIKIISVQRTSGESRQIFKGYVSQCDITSKRTAVFRISALTDDPLAMQIPSVLLSPVCQHTLGDTLCTINLELAANKGLATITSITGRTIGVSGLAGFAPTDFKFGTAKHIVSGELRSIIEQTSAASFVLNIALPSLGPFAAAIGQTITVYRGCDLAVRTCSVKFANVPNFGGHPHVVVRNPWHSGSTKRG